jgi:hypothetical protein
MSALHFEIRDDGRFDAMLGVVCVGQIIALDHPQMRTAWLVTLPPAMASYWHPAVDTDRAKDAVTQRVNTWLRAARLRAA